jgi:DNA-binding transcriptional regulator YhcF (GntR family)
MLWVVDAGSAVPLHEQVAASVRRALVEGTLGAGERLPPARAVADAVAVDPNTVLRAYRTLRDEGVLEFRRGRGVRVAEGATPRAELNAAIRDLVALARRHGYPSTELVRMIEELA